MRRDVDVFERRVADVLHSRQRFELAVDELQLRRFDRDVESTAQNGDLLRRFRFDAVRSVRSNVDRNRVVQNGFHRHFNRLFFPGFQDADPLRRVRFAGRDEEFDVFRVAVPDVAQTEAIFVFDAPFDRVAPFDASFQNRLDDFDAGSRRRSFAFEAADQLERAPFLRRHRQFKFRRLARVERSDFPNATARFAVEPGVAGFDLRVADFRFRAVDDDRFRKFRRYDQLPRRDAPDVASAHFERRLLPDDQVFRPERFNFDDRRARRNGRFRFFLRFRDAPSAVVRAFRRRSAFARRFLARLKLQAVVLEERAETIVEFVQRRFFGQAFRFFGRFRSTRRDFFRTFFRVVRSDERERSVFVFSFFLFFRVFDRKIAVVFLVRGGDVFFFRLFRVLFGLGREDRNRRPDQLVVLLRFFRAPRFRFAARFTRRRFFPFVDRNERRVFRPIFGRVRRFFEERFFQQF